MGTLLFLTGASRGFGQCLAVEFARRYAAIGSPLTMVLMARNAGGLGATAAKVLEVYPATVIHNKSVDLSDLDSIEPSWNGVIAEIVKQPKPSQLILINNAGSLGSLHTVRDMKSVKDLRKALDFNVTSVFWLTSLFLRFAYSLEAAKPSIIVNISSLAAIKAFPSQLLYCTGKAARDMLHAGIAEEEGAKVKTLNYAPGPLDTDMQAELRTSSTLHAPTRDFFISMHEERKLIDPSDSAAKCAKMVVDDAYTSGAHVDYYDLK